MRRILFDPRLATAVPELVKSCLAVIADDDEAIAGLRLAKVCFGFVEAAGFRIETKWISEDGKFVLAMARPA